MASPPLTNDRHGVVDDESAMADGARRAERRPRVMAGRHRHCWRSARTFRRLAGRCRLHLCDVTFSRGQKLSLLGCGAWRRGGRDLGSDATAAGFKIDYPNDKWDVALTSKRIGRDFDPFAGLRAEASRNISTTWRSTTPCAIDHGPLQRLFHEVEPFAGDRPPTVTGRVTACSSRRSTGGSEAETGWSSMSIRPASSLHSPIRSLGVPLDAGAYHWRRVPARSRNRPKAAVLYTD